MAKFLLILCSFPDSVYAFGSVELNFLFPKSINTPKMNEDEVLLHAAEVDEED